MGFFSFSATCGCCGNKCGLNRFKVVKSKTWLCIDCFTKAGGRTKGPSAVNPFTQTIEEIIALIDKREALAKIVEFEDKYEKIIEREYNKVLLQYDKIDDIEIPDKKIKQFELAIEKFNDFRNFCISLNNKLGLSYFNENYLSELNSFKNEFEHYKNTDYIEETKEYNAILECKKFSNKVLKYIKTNDGVSLEALLSNFNSVEEDFLLDTISILLDDDKISSKRSKGTHIYSAK